VLSDIPCNWFQCQENSCDPVHFEWMHDNWSLRRRGETGPYAPRHLKVGFEEFEFGLLYKRIREGKDETDPLWTIGRVALWPNGFYLGEHFEWRVPIDDENTLSIAWFFSRVPKEAEPYVQDRIPTWQCPLRDEQGRWITSHIMNQDFVTWIGQGRIADRTKENLGSSDGGIVMMRRRLIRDLDAIAAGRDPSGLIRDPVRAKDVALPLVSRKLYTEGMTRQEFAAHWFFKQRLTHFPWAAGQPAEVWETYAQAMGIDAKPAGSAHV
jgi:5,5'-dehydrodivanillate O-demethylase oxygenase subunit